MFNWRLENRDSYYTTIRDWWEKHEAFNGSILRKETLPNRVFVVSNDDKDLFAVPVYVSDADFCYIAFTTSNPYAELKEKVGALEYLYDKIQVSMKYNGFARVITTCNVSGLMRTLERGGFENVEQTNYFIKVL